MAAIIENHKRLGELLVEAGALRTEQVERVLEAQKERQRLDLPAFFGEICVRRGWTEAAGAWTSDRLDLAARQRCAPPGGAGAPAA